MQPEQQLNSSGCFPNTTVLTELSQRLTEYNLNRCMPLNGGKIGITGINRVDNSRIFIKLHPPSPSTDIRQSMARNEYEILTTLTSAHAPQVHDYHRLDMGTAIIFRKINAKSLAEIIDTEQNSNGSPSHSKSVNSNEFDIKLRCAEALAEALSSIHDQGVIHKDIKPVNFLIDTKSYHAWLINFEISTMLTLNDPLTNTSANILGTTAYISPEQSGRMNRPVDARSDLYSLGILLFELFSGCLPFDSTDSVEMIHSHIAKKPKRLDEKFNLPHSVAEIIDRLLRKNPEDRYQTAKALHHDLCLARKLLISEHKSDFQVNTGCIPHALRIPQKLFGRDHEIEKLATAFNRASLGSCEVVWISGASGLGKTALVEEVRRTVFAKLGPHSHQWFLKGKFDQFSQGLPLAALAQAINCIPQQYNLLSDAEKHHWKDKLTSAVGAEGHVLIEITPALKAILSDTAPLKSLSADKARARFERVIDSFFSSLCTAQRPLILFLDDLQWADRLTLDTIERFTSTLKHCLLIASYRNSEILAGHPLKTVLRSMNRSNSSSTQLVLRDFDINTTSKLVCESLGCDNQQASSLSNLLQRRTSGNPFFTVQLLRQIINDSKCVATGHTGELLLNMEHVNQVAVTDDVVELMQTRLNDFSNDTCEALGIAACLGSTFQYCELENLALLDTDCLEKAVFAGLQGGLILPLSFGTGQPRLSAPEMKAEAQFKFLHDRVQQAAYERLSDSYRASLHFRIALSWWKDLQDETEDERLFALASQLNRSASSKEYQAQHDVWQVRRAEINLLAGHRALNGGAMDSAVCFYLDGIKALPLDETANDRPLRYELHIGMAEAFGGKGEFDSADSSINTALRYANSQLEHAKLYRLLATHLQIRGHNAEALSTLRKVLPKLGCDLPEHDTELEAELSRQCKLVNQFVNKRSVESLLTNQPCTDPLLAETMRLLQLQFYAAWRGGETDLALLGLTQMTNLTLCRGTCEMSPFGLVGFGLVAVVRLKDYELADRFGKVAVMLCENFDNPGITGMTNYLYASDVMGWTHPARNTISFYDAAAQAGHAANDNLTVGFMMQQCAYEQFSFGKSLVDLESIALGYAAFLQRIGNEDNLNALRIGVLQPIANLFGDTESYDSLDNENFSEKSFLNDYCEKPYYLAWHAATRIRLAVIWRDTDKYAQLVNDLNLIETKLPSHANKLPAINFYCALMHVQLASQAKQDNTELAESHILSAMNLFDKIKLWSEHCSENAQHKTLILEAGLQAYRGNQNIALDLFDEAIRVARQLHYWNEAAIACEYAAVFLEEWNKPRIAKIYWHDAYAAYLQWGATAKAEKISQNQLVSGFEIGPPVTDMPKTPSADIIGNIEDAFDIRTALQATQVLSATSDLSSLLSQVIKTVITYTGAQSCHIYMPESQGWQLLATATDDHSHVLELAERETIASIYQSETAVLRYISRIKTILLIDSNNSVPEEISSYLTSNEKSQLFLPAVNQGEVMAVIKLANKVADGVFDTSRFAMLEFLATQIAVSLKNQSLLNKLELHSKELEELVKERTEELQRANETLANQATMDPLTRLYNRRYFDSRLQSLLENQNIRGHWLTLFFIDVDYFKQYNDRYGHQAGDQCLISIASALKKSIREKDDFAARFGGEEFVLVVIGSENTNRQATASRFLKSIQDLSISHEKSPHGTITISIGVSSEKLVPTLDLHNLIEHADSALYEAKKLGRNQVVFAQTGSRLKKAG